MTWISRQELEALRDSDERRKTLQETRDNTREELRKANLPWGPPSLPPSTRSWFPFRDGVEERESTPKIAERVVTELNSRGELISELTKMHSQQISTLNKTHCKQLNDIQAALNDGQVSHYYTAPGTFRVRDVLGMRNSVFGYFDRDPFVQPIEDATFESVQDRAKRVVQQLSSERSAHQATKRELREAKTKLRQIELDAWCRDLPFPIDEQCVKCRSTKIKRVLRETAKDHTGETDAIRPAHVHWWCRCDHSWDTKTADAEVQA